MNNKLIRGIEFEENNNEYDFTQPVIKRENFADLMLSKIGRKITEEDLLTTYNIRQECINNIDSNILLEVGRSLYTMPDRICSTIYQVADYFMVNKSTIEKTIQRNKTELMNNGLVVLKGYNLKQYKTDIANSLMTNNIDRFIHPMTPSITLLTRKCVLNIALLLRDSEVAINIRYKICTNEYDINTDNLLRDKYLYLFQMQNNLINNINIEFDKLYNNLGIINDIEYK